MRVFCLPRKLIDRAKIDNQKKATIVSKKYVSRFSCFFSLSLDIHGKNTEKALSSYRRPCAWGYKSILSTSFHHWWNWKSFIIQFFFSFPAPTLGKQFTHVFLVANYKPLYAFKACDTDILKHHKKTLFLFHSSASIDVHSADCGTAASAIEAMKACGTPGRKTEAHIYTPLHTSQHCARQSLFPGHLFLREPVPELFPPGGIKFQAMALIPVQDRRCKPSYTGNREVRVLLSISEDKRVEGFNLCCRTPRRKSFQVHATHPHYSKQR